MQKIKAELIKTLKINLVLIPIGAVILLWMYPPVSAAEEKRLMELYTSSAGWKT